MKVRSIAIKGEGIELAKVAIHAKRNRMKGMYDNTNPTAMDIYKARHKYDFKHEFNKFIEDNYVDVISKTDRKALMQAVETHYNEGCIENVEDLKRHIEVIGKREGIIFD
jgi:hypothetical protein